MVATERNFESSKVGSRLRQERERRGMSLRELARRVGVSPSLVSQIELDRVNPSVSTLYALVSELGMTMSDVFGDVPQAAPRINRSRDTDDDSLVTRPDTRRVINLASGVRWERLTPGPDERVDFLEVIYEPSGHSTDARRPLRHDGHEYGLITSGILHATVGFDTFELVPGDSIAFDSSEPHLYWNDTGQDVHAVWAVVHGQPGLA